MYIHTIAKCIHKLNLDILIFTSFIWGFPLVVEVLPFPGSAFPRRRARKPPKQVTFEFSQMAIPTPSASSECGGPKRWSVTTKAGSLTYAKAVTDWRGGPIVMEVSQEASCSARGLSVYFQFVWGQPITPAPPPFPTSAMLKSCVPKVDCSNFYFYTAVSFYPCVTFCNWA